MYKIEVVYMTGNTFNTYEEIKTIDDVEFADLESAKEALQIIAKHNEMCNKASRWGSTEEQRNAIKAEIAAQPWAVKSQYGSDYDYQLKVPTSKDCQEWSTIYCFWMGYFESIKCAKIIKSEENDGMFIQF